METRDNNPTKKFAVKLTSIAVPQILTDTSYIYDENKGKFQNDINADLYAKLEDKPSDGNPNLSEINEHLAAIDSSIDSINDDIKVIKEDIDSINENIDLGQNQSFVRTEEDLTTDKVLIGGGEKSIKKSEINISDIATIETLESYAHKNEIPDALPNPKALIVTIDGSNKSYTGENSVTINLDNTFTKPLKTVTTAGEPGIFYSNMIQEYDINNISVTSSDPDAVIIVPTGSTVTFGNNYAKMSGLDNLTGGTYKCYCITYINANLALVNGAIYG